LTKLSEKARLHQRQKRAMDREVPLAASSPEESGQGLEPVDRRPSPAEAAEFADQLEQLLGSLDAEEQQVVDLKLQGMTNEEVAERMGSSERTVRRIAKRVQRHLERGFQDDE
jgi:RNA polymerase sigma factor (sigma-70 family)